MSRDRRLAIAGAINTAGEMTVEAIVANLQRVRIIPASDWNEDSVTAELLARMGRADPKLPLLITSSAASRIEFL